MIKERIIECEYAPGSVINENQLCEQLGISRTPIRESISRLEAEGFIKVLPKKGIYVTDISLNDVLQIFQARIEIEPIAVRLAGPKLPKQDLKDFHTKFVDNNIDFRNGFRLDTAMHLFILEHCGNQYIIDMMHRVFAENTRVIISSRQNEVQIHDAQKEHLKILDLLLEEKYNDAAEYMQIHVKTCRQAALDYFYENQSLSYTSENTSYRDILDKL